jgi:hypothetical protein
MLQNNIQDNCPIFTFQYFGASEYKLQADNTHSMSSENITGERALELAKGFLAKAGYNFYFVEGLTKENNGWIVRATSLANKIILKIDRDGELIDIQRIDQ